MSRRILTHLCSADPVLAGVIAAVGALRMREDSQRETFEVLARAITYQQLNGKAAAAIFARLAALGDGAFPRPDALLAMDPARLRAVGLSFAKIASLRDLAEKTLSGVVPASAVLRTLADEVIIERLTEVRGIGRWTVEMLLMFQLGRPDVLPVDDFGVRNGFRLAYGLRAMPHPRALGLFGERWGPYRSAAAWYLWRAVELQREGRLPAPPHKTRLPRVRRLRRVRRARTGSGVSGGSPRGLSRGASSSAPPPPAGARTGARPRRARRSRAPAKKR